MNEHLREIIETTRAMVPKAVLIAGVFRAESGAGLTLHEVMLADGVLLSAHAPELFDRLNDEIDAAMSWISDGVVLDSYGGDAIIYMDGSSEPWLTEIEDYTEIGRSKTTANN